MMEEHKPNFRIPDPPRGVKAIPWRLPIWIFRLHLGWLLGHRMLLLTHRGRISGQSRQAVLEVVKYEKANNIHYVVSGFGEKSQWFQNIMNNPEVTIQVGNHSLKTFAERLSADEGEKIFNEYQQRYPNAIKNLSKLIGYQLGESDEDLRVFFRAIPVIRLQPRN